MSLSDAGENVGERIQRILNNVKLKSAATKVKEFTEQSGYPVPNQPMVMSCDQVKFLIRMQLSEIVEFAQTVMPTEDAIEFMKSAITTDLKSNYVQPTDPIEIIAQQADAAVDRMYYDFNAFAKHGVNLSKIFNVVHNANMAKKFPDGEFHKREDGKIIKPPGWQEPDIVGEIKNQLEHGTWN